jgi:hypothetical protein
LRRARDGCLDLVLSHVAHDGGVETAVVSRYRVSAPVPKAVSWAGYLGARFDSTLRPSR